MPSFEVAPEGDQWLPATWSVPAPTSGTVHVVVPAGWTDPERPSGGNTYDRQVCAGLQRLGWVVHTCEVVGAWPGPDPRSRAALAAALAGLPGGALVLLDGLVASAHPEVLVPEARRLRLVVLVHLPLGCVPGSIDEGATAEGALGSRARERAVLRSAVGVVVTSRWTRDWLLTAYGLDPDRVRAVPPGVRRARSVPGRSRGDRLVCVGAVSPVKGQDVLVSALAEVADLEWSCRCVGSVAVDPAFAEGLRSRSRRVGIGGRLDLAGPHSPEELDEVYAHADLVIVPSRVETYGMVVTEALARGIPVIGSDVGGLPEALGTTASGARPGRLVPVGDAAALGAAVRRWLTDPVWRNDLRQAARERSGTLGDWAEATSRLARVLAEVAA